MVNSTDKRIEKQIEETQAALRRSIDEARELTDRTERLLRKPEKSAGQQP